MEITTENRLTKVEESAKSAHHRLDRLEGQSQEIRELALSVNTLAASVKSLCDDFSDIACRVKDIESKPGKRLDQVIGYILAALVSGSIGFLLSALLNK